MKLRKKEKKQVQMFVFISWKKQLKMFAFISWLVSFHAFVFRYNISVMWREINSKQYISTWVNQKKIKRSRKENVMWNCFKFWPMKNIFWKLVYRFTKNYCHLRLFSEFIQTHKRYPTSLDKICILTWKLLVISS